jgi:hypothetical protein
MQLHWEGGHGFANVGVRATAPLFRAVAALRKIRFSQIFSFNPRANGDKILCVCKFVPTPALFSGVDA